MSRGRRREREEADFLYQTVGKIIGDREEMRDLSPSWIATEALRKLDATPIRKSNFQVYIAAHLYLRQIARAVCRRNWQPDEDGHEEDSDQHELLPGLQKCYPISRQQNEEAVYRKLEALTKDDYRFNIVRLRREARTKQQHADTLEARGLQIFGDLN